MKQFKYRFEKVLKAKGNAEDEIKKECAGIRAQIGMETIKLKAAGDKENLMRQSILKTASSKMCSPKEWNDIKTCNSYITYLEEFIRRKKEEIKGLEARLEALQKQLLAARMEKMTFEKIKEKDRKAYGCAVSAEEQKTTDEAALFMFRAHNAGVN
jgi:flagellar export protein FliJ